MNSKKDKNRKSMKKNVLNNQEEAAAASVRNRADARPTPARRVCTGCGKSLPWEAFYLDGVAQIPDRYCKECRRGIAVRYRAQRSRQRVEQAFRDVQRPLITTTSDAASRMKLILSARNFVLASKSRRRAKNAAAEDRRIDKELDEEETRLDQSDRENGNLKSGTEKRKDYGENK